MSYLKKHTEPTPQTEPYDARQVANEAGGYNYPVDRWTALRRFLILGTEGGTYYAGEKKLTKDARQIVSGCYDEDPHRTVHTIVEVSTGGLSPRADMAIFALAVGAAHENTMARARALNALDTVCRTGTHLFMFLDFVTAWRGWGRALRRAVADWYTSKNVDQLAYQLVKYRQRNDWTHRDVLRSAHPKTSDKQMAGLMDWACGRGTEAKLPTMIQGFQQVQNELTTIEEIANVIRWERLPREALPTHALNNPEVWQALIDAKMPMGAMVRNLGNLTKHGLLDPGSDNAVLLCGALRNQEAITKARLHPFNLLVAMLTYASGKGLRGSGAWTPNAQIVDALDSAFYLAFGNVEPIPGRTLIALDTSGSMQGPVLMGVPGMSPARAQAAMALITLASNPDGAVEIVGFDDAITYLPITRKQRLDDVYRTSALGRGSGTDCSLPIKWASEQARTFDTMIEFTDSQTWYGSTHPVADLKQYRAQTGRTRFVVNQMAYNHGSIGDPADTDTLECVGLDTATPQMIAAFARGEL